MNDNDPVTQKEWNTFLTNDFHHCVNDISKLTRAVVFIKGQLFVLIPLTIGMLAILAILLIEIL